MIALAFCWILNRSLNIGFVVELRCVVCEDEHAVNSRRGVVSVETDALGAVGNVSVNCVVIGDDDTFSDGAAELSVVVISGGS
jgi:hypothetical protein